MFNIVNIKFISTLSFLWHKRYNSKLVRNFNKPIKSNEAAWCLNKPLNKSLKHCFVSIFNNGGHLASSFLHCHVTVFGAIARNARVVLAIVLYYPNTVWRGIDAISFPEPAILGKETKAQPVSQGLTSATPPKHRLRWDPVRVWSRDIPDFGI
jgi:hypothetical protein